MLEPQKEIEPTIAANTEKTATYVGGPPAVIATLPVSPNRWIVCEP